MTTNFEDRNKSNKSSFFGLLLPSIQSTLDDHVISLNQGLSSSWLLLQ